MTTGTRSRLRLALTLSMLACFAPAARAQPAAAGDAGLQPGDVVQITVWQRDELSGEFTVTSDGSLNHPLYRQVRVTGVPVGQVEERVRSFLSAYEANPQIVVQPMYKVAIAGAVMQPNIYDLPPGTTVAQAIVRAGGVSEEGRRDNVLLVRSGRETRLDLSDVQAVQMPLQSGDQLVVTTEREGRGFIDTVLPILHMAMTITNLVLISQR